MKTNVLFIALIVCMFGTSTITSQTTLTCDYTNGANAKTNIPYHLDVFNRIHPADGFRMPSTPNAKLCIVRPLGGISKSGNPQLSQDSYRWDGSKFVTDFSRLKTQIDRVLSRGVGIHQIVLDNPSWDFQRNSDGSLPGGNYKVSVYGNAEPPRDYNAWANYLKEVMRFLIDTYGREEMAKVQFGIGREIGTKGHWTGTQDQFFRFYRRSVQAVRSVMPEAIVGSHFLWGSAREPWGDDFVRWCKSNTVDYDFVGVSYYPFYNQSGRIDLEEVYAKDFGVIKDIPEWDPNARLEVHEFALLETLGGQGNVYTEASDAHQNAFMVALMKMFFEHDMVNLFQWGPGDNYAPANTEIFTLKGNTYYKSIKSGNQNSNNNYVDGLFTYDPGKEQYNIMAYNHSHRPDSNIAEDLNFKATVNAPAGSSVQYRLAIYNKANGTLPWSNWMSTTTTSAPNNKSAINLSAKLPAFSFLKYEIKVDASNNGSAPTVRIDSPTENQMFDQGYDQLLVKTFISDPDGDLLSAELFIDNTSVGVKDTRPFTWGEDNETLGLNPGPHVLKLVAVDRKGNTAQDEVIITVKASQEQQPYAGIPLLVPGVIEAENYDLGGEGVSYSDTTPANEGNQYRTDEAVDIGQISVGEGYYLGWTMNGEWVEYTINVEEETKYDFKFRYSTIRDNTSIGAEIPGMDEVLFTDMSFDNTGDWNLYQEKVQKNVSLPKGEYVLRLTIPRGGFNLDKVQIVKSDDTTLGVTDFEQRNQKLMLHPNPSKSGVLWMSRSLDWRVYSVHGKFIARGSGNKVDLSMAADGVYILKTNKGDSKKIVLN